MRRPCAVTILACLVLAAPVAALEQPERSDTDPRVMLPRLARVGAEVVAPGDPSPAGERARAFLSRYGGTWEIWFEPRVDLPVLVQGSGIPMVPGRGNSLDKSVLAGLPRSAGKITLDTLEPLARAFVDANPGLLRPSRGSLELDRRTSLIREGGRLASIHYQWKVDGVPVEGAVVFLRLNSGNLTQFGAPLVGSIGIDTRAVLGADQAVERLMQYSGDAELYRLRGEPELIIQSEDGIGPRIDYRLVWRIAYRATGRIETWEGRVDARTGEIVGFRDINAYARVVGGVYPRSVFYQNEVRVPFPLVDVSVQGLPSTSDAAGRFAYSGDTASSALDGRWFDTFCDGCNNPAQPDVQVSIGTGWLDFGLGGQDEAGNGNSTPADRNSFYHLNQIRRVAKKWLPAQPWIDTTITSRVNIYRVCNAYYDGDVNFFRSGGGCNNSGEVADVIYHEWGHGLDLNTLAGDGATGEATGDIVAMHLSHSPLVGPGFRTTGEPIRNLDSAGPRGLLTTANISTKCSNLGDIGPLGYEVHCEGEIYGQAAWELSQALVEKYGHHTGWRASERMFFTSLPDAASYLASGAMPVYSAYLNADDDDGNMANGTPNATEIFEAFDRHGIAGMQQAATAPCSRPSQPLLSVVPRCAEFDLSWDAVAGADHYEVFRGELRADQALFPVASLPAGQTAYTDDEVAPAMDYWYVVMAVDGTGCESTIENPVAARLPAQPLISVIAAEVDDEPRGNRSGFADPGEEVDLILSLRNHGEIPAATVGGTITSSTPDVTILDGAASWPQLDPDATAQNLDPLRFRAEIPASNCGDVIRFELVPDEASGCAVETSYFEIELGNAGVCDPAPSCFIEPTFDGLETVSEGGSCAETTLAWQSGTSNCEDGLIRYNVYRSTDPAFMPSPASLVEAGLSATTFVDSQLVPGQIYHYIVRADDSHSGEDSNAVVQSIVAPELTDIRPPVFSGLADARKGSNCGEVVLLWGTALDSCSPSVSFEIYRGTDPAFQPGPATWIGSSLSLAFVDAALQPNTDYTYLVRARDAAGNEDTNDVRVTAPSGATDLLLVQTGFETSADGWSVVQPDDADTGNWERGNPETTDFQPGNCSGGSNCWITGLAATLSDGNNNDVDAGTTTLLSRSYDVSGAVTPAVRYSRWFTNDLGASPGEDPLVVEISDDDGGSWRTVETVGPGTPLAWVPVTVPFPPGATATDRVRLRFTAADLGAGSLVEAGVDEFELIDRNQGCIDCSLPVTAVGTILVDRSGDDVVLDWSADPAPGSRFVIYKLVGPAFDQAIRVGTTTSRTFVHSSAGLSEESFFYRVSAVDACGDESALD